LTACSSSRPASGPVAGNPPALSRADGTAPDAAATGSTLKNLLRQRLDLSSAVAITDTSDSGQDWTSPQDPPAQAIADADCSVMPQITADEASADYRAAYAKETLTEHGVPIAQIVLAATNPGDAAQQLAEVQALADRCQTFSAANAHGVNVAGAVAATAIPGLGDQALDVRVTATGPDAAAYQQPELILVRVGDKLVAISDNYPGGDDSSARKAAQILADRLTGQPA
jgi:antitoxin (DNA-binding transcriptional repressor) of toxin-antitoxin stability system